MSDYSFVMLKKTSNKNILTYIYYELYIMNDVLETIFTKIKNKKQFPLMIFMMLLLLFNQ